MDWTSHEYCVETSHTFLNLMCDSDIPCFCSFNVNAQRQVTDLNISWNFMSRDGIRKLTRHIKEQRFKSMSKKMSKNGPTCHLFKHCLRKVFLNTLRKRYKTIINWQLDFWSRRIGQRWGLILTTSFSIAETWMKHASRCAGCWFEKGWACFNMQESKVLTKLNCAILSMV